ncbi:MAG TPA: tripartite tricarboxylate transporter substrate binding protein [Paenalcaligenes sp.]|nr:tripartite tricarboxylate transporter substrate binding protein [Paenalcaligenes sp.]
MRKFFGAFCFATLAAVAAPALAATDYPNETVKMVVPFPPGGPTDGMARLIAKYLGEHLDTPVIVENKGGAGGNIGSQYVAGAKPDGYTLLFGTSGPLAINVSLYQDITYDPRTSFDPIARIGHLPNILVINPELPADNLSELIDYAKNNPGTLTYGSSGNGASSHLAGVMFNRIAGTDVLHIPYRGTGPALVDLIAGQTDMTFTDVMTAIPHIEEGRLKAIGVTTDKRSDSLPDTPTLEEQGLEDYDVSVFFGVVGPKGMDPEVVEKLNIALVDVLNEDEVRNLLTAQGIVQAEDHSPQALKAFIDTEVEKWAEIIKSENVVLD